MDDLVERWIQELVVPPPVYAMDPNSKIADNLIHIVRAERMAQLSQPEPPEEATDGEALIYLFTKSASDGLAPGETEISYHLLHRLHETYPRLLNAANPEDWQEYGMLDQPKRSRLQDLKESLYEKKTELCQLYCQRKLREAGPEDNSYVDIQLMPYRPEWSFWRN